MNRGLIAVIVLVQLYQFYTLHHQLKLAKAQLAALEANKEVKNTA